MALRRQRYSFRPLDRIYTAFQGCCTLWNILSQQRTFPYYHMRRRWNVYVMHDHLEGVYWYISKQSFPQGVQNLGRQGKPTGCVMLIEIASAWGSVEIPLDDSVAKPDMSRVHHTAQLQVPNSWYWDGIPGCNIQKWSDPFEDDDSLVGRTFFAEMSTKCKVDVTGSYKGANSPNKHSLISTQGVPPQNVTCLLLRYILLRGKDGRQQFF